MEDVQWFLKIGEALASIGETYSLAPFDAILQPVMDETLRELEQDHWRRGTLLIPRVLIWLVLVLTVRRDLNCDRALNWMVSGFRWLVELLPAQSQMVSDGAISHARVKVGVEVFRVLWVKLGQALPPVQRTFTGVPVWRLTGAPARCPILSPTGRRLANRVRVKVKLPFPKCA
jgi:hypothetical protein